MATTSPGTALGTPAPDFDLPLLDGGELTLAELAGSPALLVAFVCNHCPYVRHVEDELGRVAAEHAAAGLRTVAVCSNDVEAYPDDGPDGLRAQVARAGWTFPYLLDTGQDVARAYGAVCTPDLFLYDADRRLAYRGALDGSTPGNGVPVTGEDLRRALTAVLAGEAVPEPHRPALGCSVKWRESA